MSSKITYSLFCNTPSSKSITENITLQVKVRDYIMETDAKIRELPLFYMIQDDYEEIF